MPENSAQPSTQRALSSVAISLPGPASLSLFQGVVAFILAACLIVPAEHPAAAQDISQNAIGGEEHAQDAAGPAIPIVPEIDDSDIEERLQSILGTTRWFSEVGVEVRNGVVFLDGSTSAEEHQEWAARTANRMEGVVATINNIEVESDADAIFILAWQELKGFFVRLLSAWPLLLVAALILLASWLAARLVGRLSRRTFGQRISSPLLLTVTARALSLSVFVLGLYFVLRVAGLTGLAVTVLGGTGLLGIIIGFAFRDIAENFLASLLLSIRNPFRAGDLIEVDGSTGIVQNLNTRSTVLLTLEGTHIQIPNATIFKSTIVNYSSNASRRAEFIIGIGYDSSTAKAQAIIANVLKDHPAVLNEPEPLVLVDQLGAASVDLRVFYWFDTATFSPAKINSAILRLCKNALLKAGVELPDPAREIIFPRGVPVIQGEHPAGEPETARAPRPDADETSAATMGEGNLSNETDEVRTRARGQVAEASENLLKR